jgi:hypothetical protein
VSLDIDLECAHCKSEIVSKNYTHNVIPMWEKAGCYEALYKSDGDLASGIIPWLRSAVEAMEANPEEYIALNPENGWGSYDTALPWLKELLAECIAHPDAVIRVSA